MSLFEMLRGLQGAGIRFVVVGGVAAVAHGSNRVTVDLDVCYDTSPENRERLAGVLARWHAYPREVEPGLPFAMDARTLESMEVLTLTSDAGPIDLFQRVSGVGDYAACREAGEEAVVDDLRFSVLNLAALIASKRAAGRPRDMEALRELEALQELKTKDRSS